MLDKFRFQKTSKKCFTKNGRYVEQAHRWMILANLNERFGSRLYRFIECNYVDWLASCGLHILL